jgi:hypothetical protein
MAKRFRIPNTGISFEQTDAQLADTADGAQIFAAVNAGRLECDTQDAIDWHADAGSTGVYVDPL